jgi:hypothetical protein
MSSPQYFSKATMPVPDQIGAINVNLTYATSVLGHCVYVTRLIPELLKSGHGLERYDVLAAKYAMRGLHSLIRGGIHPKFKDQYIEKSDELLKKISDKSLLESKQRRHELIDYDYDLLDLITDNFGAAGILPPIEETTDLSTLESKKTKENERALKIAIKLLRKHGPILLKKIQTKREAIKSGTKSISGII